VTKSNWHANRAQAKQHAFSVLRDLERPPSITPRQWVGVKAFLYVVARGQPKFYKSQETIAESMGVTTRSVQRYVRLAKEAELLVVWENSGTGRRGNPSKTNRYLLAAVSHDDDNLSASVDDKLSSNKTVGTPVPHYQSKALSEREQALTLPSASRPPQAVGIEPEGMVLAVGRADEIAEDANAFGRINRPKRKSRPARDPDPARRLVSHFCGKWEGLIERRPEFKDIRPAHIGSATAYFRNTFLSPKDGPSRSEADVEELINRFMDAVYRGKIRIKPDQTVFQCFTGSWHRQATRQPYEQDVYEKFRRKHLGT